jgi:hypothetical protein
VSVCVCERESVVSVVCPADGHVHSIFDSGGIRVSPTLQLLSYSYSISPTL